MRIFHNLPIKYKLVTIIMVTVIVSLLLVGTAVILSVRYQEKNSMIERFTTLSRIIADRSTAALSFDDKRAAKENLSALNQESTVEMGCIYNNFDILFSSYYKKNVKNKCPELIVGTGFIFLDEYLEIYQSVILDNEEIGTVFIQASLSELNDRQIQFIILLLIIIIISSLVSYFLAITQQAVISKPILILAEIAKKISNEANYSMSVPESSDDEIGSLNHAFNNMLEQIRKREVARDIAEQELKEKEKHLNTTLNSIADAVITTDTNGIITRMNPVAELLTGWSFSEAKDKKLNTIFSLIDNATKELIEDPVNKVLATNDVVHLTSSTVLISKGGKKYRIADSGSGAPIIDEKEIIQGVILVFSDMTKQYQTEDALRRSQKMDAIGQLTGGIAHDFNNRLGVIIGYLDILKNHLSRDTVATQWIDTALKASLRCSDLTRQLLAFSRHENTVTKKAADISKEFKELEDMIARSVTPEIEVQYFIHDNLYSVEIDVGEFHDIILNLVINAHDAIKGSGKILIEACNCYLDEDYVKLNPDVSVGHYAQLTISDTGSGMDKKTLEHVFEPFYTTKPKGKGTGLGMSMVYGFVKRYNGHIKIYSEIDIGTRMRIYLPRSETETSYIENDFKKEILVDGTETILIVDDESELLQLAETYLSDSKYTTYTAKNGVDAIEMLRENDSIDMLFSDVVMPGGMNGYELAQQAIELRPNLKILMTSGFTSKTIIQNNLSPFSVNLLSKPYRKPELLRRIRKVLDDEVINYSKSKDVQVIFKKQKNIMVVDSNDNVRSLFNSKLTKVGYKIILASNNIEALKLYQIAIKNNEFIEVIIINHNPEIGLNAQDLSVKIKEINTETKIIVFNNKNEDQEISHYKDYGFNGAFEKKFDWDNIKSEIENVLK